MPSGAGHDAQMMARVCPTAMVFTPSRDGLSATTRPSTPRRRPAGRRRRAAQRGVAVGDDGAGVSAARTLVSLWRAGAPADPEAPFLRVPGGEEWTYARLEQESGRLANGLVVAGVVPGDRVAGQLEKSPGVLALYLACLRAGAVFLPMNTSYTPAEVDYLVGDVAPALVLARRLGGRSSSPRSLPGRRRRSPMSPGAPTTSPCSCTRAARPVGRRAPC